MPEREGLFVIPAWLTCGPADPGLLAFDEAIGRSPG